ncbi:MAG: hypothetical protein WCJ56_01180 [bacterium]
MMDTLEASCEDVWTPRPGSWEEAVYSYEEQCTHFRYAPTFKNNNRPMCHPREDQCGENQQTAMA